MLSRLPWHWRGTMRSLPRDPRLRNAGCNAGPGTGQLARAQRREAIDVAAWPGLRFAAGRERTRADRVTGLPLGNGTTPRGGVAAGAAAASLVEEPVRLRSPPARPSL